MSEDIMESINRFKRGMDALKRAAKNREVAVITPEQAAEIVKHVEWLGKERESLIRSLPDDD